MDPTLYVVLDRTAARGRDLDELLTAVIEGGCRMVQLREKDWPSGRLWPLARRLRERCGRAGVTFVVNDRVDLAVAVEADGVHVGQDDLPARVARPLLRAGMLLGVSTHDLELDSSTGFRLAPGDIAVATVDAGPVIVATLGANDFVGEMAILGDVPRNATVRAKDRVIALRISREPFMRMVREFPTMAVSIMQELAHRLDLTNHQLSTALAEVKRLREGSGVAA